ncbi:CPBP family glutamic-type intramembrane protease [Sporomusa ovata]|uniref:CPBP family glutamic-type intramembrane protease n=1 Tax=Sporomusa ovata TaxID=2378 RepID=UPI0008FC062C
MRDPRRGFFIFTPVPANTGIIHLKNEAKQESNLQHSWTKVLSKAWLLKVSSYTFFSSLIFTWVYDKYKTIIAPIIVHILSNILVECFYIILQLFFL